MLDLKLKNIVPWTSHLSASPLLTREANDTLSVAANGTRTCMGGWQAHYTNVTPGQTYQVQWDVDYEDLDHPFDALRCRALWTEVTPEQARHYETAGKWGSKWEYILPEKTGSHALRFIKTIQAPADGAALTLRSVFRWSTKGRAVWQLPQVSVAERPEYNRPPVRVAVVTGHMYGRQQRVLKTIPANVTYYADLCEKACQGHPNLIVLPEWCLQLQVPGHPLEYALPAPGPETDVFAGIARRHKVRIVLPFLERDGDAVHNSAVLISPEGIIDGKYHKVHLADGREVESGIRPGDTFPVFETEIGRLGCNICMDSSAAESSRMIGLNGADFMLMPIMGDLRADRWSVGAPLFNESRWKAIMRTRAMDNQYCLVAARNEAQGSCIIDRKGDILAWNEGDLDFIQATVNLDDGYTSMGGVCFREVTWMQRRPHLYQAFTEEGNQGSLK